MKLDYSIKFEKQVQKFLLKLNISTQKRILDKIEQLKLNPVPSSSKRIINASGNNFRIRVGIYRILYRIEGSKLIIIYLINKRSNVYKKND